MKLKFLYFLSFILLLFSGSQAFSQSTTERIPFRQNVFEEAISDAVMSGKPSLFYFRSDYCYVCLPLDSLLEIPSVMQYFSANYVNVSIDFYSPIGQRLAKKYNVRSLPSLLFLNAGGDAQFLIDEAFETETMLNFARLTINPMSGEEKYKQSLALKDKMLNWERIDELFDFTVIENMVFEKETELTMYNQTIMHKTLNDGQAFEHAQKYLKTQSDWTSEKNMQFILDFVDDTRSDAFQFLLVNRDMFIQAFGKETIDARINYLVNKRLYQLQPPPNYEEVVNLMAAESPENTDLRTYDYLIDVKLKTGKIVDYLSLERKYLSKFAPKDHERMIRMIKIYLDEIPDDYNADYYINLAVTANKLFPNSVDYQYTLARLYLKKGDKCGALEAAVKAYSLSVKQGDPVEYILDQILEIDKLH